MKDTIKTIICVIAIVVAVVAYLRSDGETMGVLRQQYLIEDQIVALDKKIAELYGEVPKGLRDILN